ncbi:hypothetical protein KGP36_06795 [Patescibacteria group bacterium]|nr:hypothetical protein [Patescibacteria group bacterium]
MTPTQIPDLATLEGEELNYWCGVAAGKDMERILAGKAWIHWNPIQDAAQCLALTPRCNIQWYAHEYCLVNIILDDGKCSGAAFGHTELIARCRAFLEAKRREG